MYDQIKETCAQARAKLIVVSKNQALSKIQWLYSQGQRDFAENRVQNLLERKEVLPTDIQWHMIGHLQTNKVKYIAGFIHMIHSVDSLRLLEEIDKQAALQGRIIPVLLQIKIASEETKYGFSMEECRQLWQDGRFHGYTNIKVCGLMGMASLTDDEDLIRQEFHQLRVFFEEMKGKDFVTDNFRELSMGMSGDYQLALQEHSTMVRVGSLIFDAIP